MGVVMKRAACPRVARSSQPWAGGHNPFGIGNRDLGVEIRLPTVFGPWAEGGDD